MAEKTYTLSSQDDILTFWEKEVVARLDDRQVFVLFVANDISDELELVVKFLNKHTHDNLEILAVEVKKSQAEATEAPGSCIKNERVPYCLCGCGAVNNAGFRFKSGHDARLNGWLTRLEKDDFGIDGALTYVAEICRKDPDVFRTEQNQLGLFYNKYSPKDVIRLDEMLANHRQQN